jgi:hypothetical protein
MTAWKGSHAEGSWYSVRVARYAHTTSDKQVVMMMCIWFKEQIGKFVIPRGYSFFANAQSPTKPWIQNRRVQLLRACGASTASCRYLPSTRDLFLWNSTLLCGSFVSFSSNLTRSSRLNNRNVWICSYVQSNLVPDFNRFVTHKSSFLWLAWHMMFIFFNADFSWINCIFVSRSRTNIPCHIC